MDMSNPAVQQRYDEQIFDGARDLAVFHRGDISGMKLALTEMNFHENQIEEVISAMQSPEYFEMPYRGDMADEGVIEALKNGLRPIHGF